MNATGGEVVLCAGRPAVHHNGPVACFALHFSHFVKDSNDSLHVGALSIRSPVLDVELSHLVALPRLENGRKKSSQYPTQLNLCLLHSPCCPQC